MQVINSLNLCSSKSVLLTLCQVHGFQNILIPVIAGAAQNLFYDHDPETTTPDLSAKEALDLLRDLCGTMETEVIPETSKLFSKLVSQMKRMDTRSLTRVYNQASKDSFCKGSVERVRYVILK